MSDIAERVKKIVVEHLGVDAAKVTDNASFIDDLGADSLDTVELVMAFEEEFSVEIPDDAAEKIATVKDAIDFIKQPKKARRPRVTGYSSVASLDPAEHLNSMRRVVVTGMGMVSPLGVGVGVNWRRLIAGDSGLARITHFDPSDMTCQVAGQVPRGDAPGHLNLDRYIEPKEQKKMDNFIHFAIAAADEAIKDSGYVPADRRSSATGSA